MTRLHKWGVKFKSTYIFGPAPSGPGEGQKLSKHWDLRCCAIDYTDLDLAFCLFDLILYIPESTIFQLCWDGSFWVEPVLSKDKYVLLKDTTQ